MRPRSSTHNSSNPAARLWLARRVIFPGRWRIWSALGVVVFSSIGLYWWNTRPRTQQEALSTSRWPQSTAVMRAPGRLRVLFLGNSLTAYNGGQALILEQLSTSAGKKPAPVFDQLARYGATWAVLYNDTRAVELIQQGKWDYVVLQDYSTAPQQYRLEMNIYGRMFSQQVQSINARPIFFMTWPHQGEPPTQQQIAGAYISVAQSNHGIVAPVGLAWQKVLHDRPGLTLYDPRDRPAKHPTPAGSYLAACVFYSMLYHQSPRGLTGRIVEGINVYIDLKHADAEYLQEAAWQTVLEAAQLASTRPAMVPSSTGPTTAPSVEKNAQ